MTGRQNEPKTLSKFDSGACSLLLLLLPLLPSVLGGFEQNVDPEKLIRALYGNPCDCQGGYHLKPGLRSTQSVDCGSKIAYLQFRPSSSTGEVRQEWVCKQKPQPLPPTSGGTCPVNCVELTQVHSRCYKTYQKCIKNNQNYLVARLTSTYEGGTGGEWGPEVFKTPYETADCRASVGDVVCWPLKAPVHISDGGGPTDQERERKAIEWAEQEIQALVPKWPKHPSLQAQVPAEELDPNTQGILETTHRLLNQTNPSLAADCWLCMKMSNNWPLAIPVPKSKAIVSGLQNCTYVKPFKVVPYGFNSSICYARNTSLEVDLGQIEATSCLNISQVPPDLGCLPPGQVWVCGGNLAYSLLPQNGTGVCIPALLLPNIDIVPGTEPIPLPSIDLLGGTYVHRSRRAVTFLPLQVGLGLVRGLGMGAAGLGISLDRYDKLSEKLISDVEQVYKPIQGLQDQLDSLARVVLQNRQGLDLILAEKGGLCAALQEECCFYTNKSGIVRDRIRNHQEELAKRRKELYERPLWSLWGGILPYLIPVLGPLLGILMLVAIGPCINRLTAFICTQVGEVKLMVLKQQYQELSPSAEEYLERQVP